MDEFLPDIVKPPQVAFIDSEFSFEEGFSRLDWDNAWALVESRFPEGERFEA